MPELSVIIPNRNCQFTTQTINDVLKNAGCDLEVIVHVDEKWPVPLSTDSRVHYIHPPAPIGLRKSINRSVAMAKGKYIMKTDDHCAFGENFGRILIENHQKDWVQIPRRYALDAENWKIEERTDGKYPIDYMSLDFPLKGKEHDDGMHGIPWKRDRIEEIDDTPSLQGSCYFMEKTHFTDFLGGMSEEGYGQFAQEAQEIGFKTWLGGGAVKVNKKTWYAHLHKGNRYGRMYQFPSGTPEASNWSAEYWLNNRWPKQVLNFSWFINEKFPDMPKWGKDWELRIKEMGWTK
jgi:glycosyltransferase involved in cell wall biosynthesis